MSDSGRNDKKCIQCGSDDIYSQKNTIYHLSVNKKIHKICGICISSLKKETYSGLLSSSAVNRVENTKVEFSIQRKICKKDIGLGSKPILNNKSRAFYFAPQKIKTND